MAPALRNNLFPFFEQYISCDKNIECIIDPPFDILFFFFFLVSLFERTKNPRIEHRNQSLGDILIGGRILLKYNLINTFWKISKSFGVFLQVWIGSCWGRVESWPGGNAVIFYGCRMPAGTVIETQLVIDILAMMLDVLVSVARTQLRIFLLIEIVIVLEWTRRVKGEVTIVEWVVGWRDQILLMFDIEAGLSYGPVLGWSGEVLWIALP